ncbi:MAG: hypothetical protein ISQ98_03230 [Flavobacteriaceae bacterium]|nr:hypothetical protein [Flavobacteriaceae bacterium]
MRKIYLLLLAINIGFIAQAQEKKSMNFEISGHLAGGSLGFKKELEENVHVGARIGLLEIYKVLHNQTSLEMNKNRTGGWFFADLFMQKQLNTICLEGVYKYNMISGHSAGDGAYYMVHSFGTNVYYNFTNWLSIGSGIYYSLNYNAESLILWKPIILKFDIGLVKKKNKK